MDKFIDGYYNDAIECWEAMLVDNEKAMLLSDYEKLLILNNIATAELKLELYRKCLKSTEKIINKDNQFIPCYILQGNAYNAIGKYDEAIEIWKKGFSLCHKNVISDTSSFIELQSLIKSHYKDNNHELIQQKTDVYTNIHQSKAMTIMNNTNSSTIGSVQTRTTINRSDEIVALFQSYIGTDMNSSFLLTMKQVRASLSFACGDDMIDDLIAFGYLSVNTEKLDIAVHIFVTLLKYNNNLPAAFLGLGSSYAMLGKLDEAISVFTQLIIKDPTISDAWKRRGQTRAAKNLFQDAISDLQKAAELGSDADVYNQIGLLYHQNKNFSRALSYFRKAHEKGVNTASLLNFIGISLGQLGDVDESLKLHSMAMKLDPNFKETALNHALMLKEVGRWKEALIEFEEIEKLDINQTFHQLFSYKATLLYQLGQAMGSFHTSIQAIDALNRSGKTTDTASIILAACAMHSIGNYKTALLYYDEALVIDSSNSCWFQREIALYTWSRLDTPIEELADDLDSRIKIGFCKKSNRQLIIDDKDDSNKYEPFHPPSKSVPTFEDDNDRGKIEQQEVLLDMIRPLIPLVQLNSQGFLPNKRQHTSFGLSVLEIAQTIRMHLTSIARLGWRQFFNIAVRWRCISEPGDPVFWIDSLPQKDFEEGFGLQTPLVNGQMKTIRYYAYFPQAFARMTSLLGSGYFNIDGNYEVLSLFNRKQLESANSLEDVRRIVGQDFYVIVPCESENVCGLIMEGTRLTLLTHEPEGYEFTIRTPGLPQRWSLFDSELQVIFDKLLDLISNKENSKEEISKEEIVYQSLKLYYYWVVFAPLSRGTALCGYAMLSGTLQAAGFEIEGSLPKNIQLDWEAILATNFKAFLPVALSMLKIVESTVATGILLRSKIKTLRDMIRIINT